VLSPMLSRKLVIRRNHPESIPQAGQPSWLMTRRMGFNPTTKALGQSVATSHVDLRLSAPVTGSCSTTRQGRSRRLTQKAPSQSLLVTSWRAVAGRCPSRPSSTTESLLST
jgi:hypothetical protein